MPRPIVKIPAVNLDDREVKRKLMAQVGALTGVYEVLLAPKRNTRSLRANSFYWAAVATPFADFLSSQDYAIVTPEDAHLLLKQKLLPKQTVADPKTGELVGEILSPTHTMDVEQFSDFVERARVYLAEMFGIETLDPIGQAVTR